MTCGTIVNQLETFGSNNQANINNNITDRLPFPYHTKTNQTLIARKFE